MHLTLHMPRTDKRIMQGGGTLAAAASARDFSFQSSCSARNNQRRVVVVDFGVMPRIRRAEFRFIKCIKANGSRTSMAKTPRHDELPPSAPPEANAGVSEF